MFSAFDLSISNNLFMKLKQYNDIGRDAIGIYSDIGQNQSVRFDESGLNDYISCVLNDNYGRRSA